LFDIDIPILAKSIKEFSHEGIILIAPDYAVANICNDKWKTHNFLLKNNINTPKSFISLQEAIDQIQMGVIDFPLIIKPRWGMGSIGIYEVKNQHELKNLYNYLQRQILATYIKYESQEELSKSIIIQEKISGQEYGLDIINDLKNNYVTTLIKKKIAMRAGETDHAIVEEHPNLSKIGSVLGKKLKHISILDVDCFLAMDNSIYILEMNCRFGGHYPFAHLAGANIPLAIVNWLQGSKPDEKLFNVRFGTEGIKDIIPTIIQT